VKTKQSDDKRKDEGKRSQPDRRGEIRTLDVYYMYSILSDYSVSNSAILCIRQYRPFALKAMVRGRKDGLVVKVVTQNSGDLVPIPGSDTNLV